MPVRPPRPRPLPRQPACFVSRFPPFVPNAHTCSDITEHPVRRVLACRRRRRQLVLERNAQLGSCWRALASLPPLSSLPTPPKLLSMLLPPSLSADAMPEPSDANRV